MKWLPDGRVYAEDLVLRAVATDGGITLVCPTVGWWREQPAPGTVLSPGASVGQLEVLGRLYRLVTPPDAAGVVLADDTRPRVSRLAVDTRTPLLTLDPEGSVAAASASAGATAKARSDGLVFLAPLSGRYYARPAPGEPAFIEVGDEIQAGQAVALLEVMKTFNRISYGGDGLPARAKVLAIVPHDEADVEEDDVLLRLEPA